jgi:glycosyltransferase involved in cell wall biosynthesis
MLDSEILKVLIIATTKFELDGITNVILNYYGAIDKSDMQIDFVVPNDIRDDLRVEIESCGSKIFKISNRNKKPILYIKSLTKLIRENNYNIVHAHGNSCTLALEMYSAQKGGVKVRIPHSHSSKNKHRFVHKIFRKLFDISYTHPFACGQKAGEWLYNGKKFQILNNGIQVDKYKYNAEIRVEYRSKYNFSGKKVVGHIGHFISPKNHEYLIDIFAELFELDKNYRLVLIGEGALATSIKTKVNRLGLSNSVIFIGKSLDVPQLMQAIDLIVMPSKFEGLPLTLVEAQSACLPCFVSDAVSREARITDLVEFISLEKSPKAWATLIHESNLVNREALKSKIVNQIIDAGYSVYDNAKKMKKLYKLYMEQGKS